MSKRRDFEAIKILPGNVPVIGSTEVEAKALDAELDQLIRPEYAKQQLARRCECAPKSSTWIRSCPRTY
jgi:alkanesulfonate monooxygenase SsuD/methylene tetrahydromethanopterin reductase-like flavin-dependent oxidoreductase (luciferase family)